jgi:hypothetical protein
MSLHLEKQASFQAGFLDHFWRQTFHSIPPIPAGIDLAGKTALVTGSNGGLGLECARHFLKLRPSLLILAVRSLQKGEAAAVGLRRLDNDYRIEPYRLIDNQPGQVQAIDGETVKMSKWRR